MTVYGWPVGPFAGLPVITSTGKPVNRQTLLKGNLHGFFRHGFGLGEQFAIFTDMPDFNSL